MPPTEKHRETAEQITNDYRMIEDGCEGDLMEMIATALANAEREGMMRAAEIADSHCMDHDDAELCQGCGEIISAAILSEAGEG